MAVHADALTVSADRDLDSALNTWVDLAGADDTLTYHPGGVYNWANKDGANTVAIAGLSLGAQTVKTDNGSALTLDLNGGTITATSGDLSTAVAGGATAGALTVTNAGSIALDDLFSTNPVGLGGNMTITHRGALTADQISANPGGDIYFDGNCGSAAGSAGGLSATKIDSGDSTTNLSRTVKGDVFVKGYTNVVVGDRITSARIVTVFGDGYAGNVTIGDPGPANAAGHIAGLIKVGAIYCTSKPAGGAGTCLSGDVSIYGKDDVLIKNSSDVIGDILTYPDITIRDCDGGTVTVKHDGAFAVRDVISRVGNANDTYAGRPLYFDGDVLSNGITAGKNYSARTLETTVGGTGNYKPGGRITIKGYDNVAVGSLITYQASTHFNTGGRAGDILITNIQGTVSITNSVSAYAAKTAGGGNLSICSKGDILISATSIDLRSMTAPAANGVLSVMATGSTAKVSIGNLDLDKVLSAVIFASRRHSIVTNSLTGFPVSDPANGKLDAVTGQTIHYDSRIPSNAYLTNGYSGRFTLKSGGVLVNSMMPGLGTVITLK